MTPEKTTAFRCHRCGDIISKNAQVKVTQELVSLEGKTKLHECWLCLECAVTTQRSRHG